MNSKEALEELQCVLVSNQATKRYSDIFEENLLRPIEKDLEVLEEHRKIEEYLGMDLITLFNIEKQLNTKKEIWFKIEDEIEENFRFDSYYIIDLKHKAFVKIEYEPLDYLYFKDYGKTWASTKEELENDK